MTYSHILGYPRIGIDRKMKTAVEAYWRSEISQSELHRAGEQIQQTNWQTQADAGLDFITVNDFSWYDHVLDTSILFGVIPERFERKDKLDLNTLFCMARGQAPQIKDASACEMTKWFNTNYHYIVPEFTQDQTFHLTLDTLFSSIDLARNLGYRVKPVLLGPLTFLWLGKIKNADFNKLDLLKNLLSAYNEIFKQFQARNIEWVQIDEPILVLDLPQEWQVAFIEAYQQFNFNNVKCLLTTYFGSLGANLSIVKQLPINGLHIDLCSDATQLPDIIAQLSSDIILSAGIINGRNIWRSDFQKSFALLKEIKTRIGDRLWVASSCSLLHVPVDLEQETQLDSDLKNWLAFAKQKVHEVAILTKAVNKGEQTVRQQFLENQSALHWRAHSTKIHNLAVNEKLKNLSNEFSQRNSPYKERAKKQRSALKLPPLATTTIGSFPQTKDIRAIRHEYKKGKMDHVTYTTKIKNEIAETIRKQEQLDLDVLVHGEAERNDMVEYFGELLQGFAFTTQGWVQSYGSRCVKPPIIFGDVWRSKPMTVDWSQYAQSLSSRLVKGMLTGPVTIAAWSFVRDDQPFSDTVLQIALALRDEVIDLEKSGIQVIQIDEPAFREALPLRKKDWQGYFDWAIQAFRITSCGVQDQTQIHTHMCYSEFNDIIEAIAALDADVITIESSRSQMELLQALKYFNYPNEIGPGVYDIHSPQVPSVEKIVEQLDKALHHISAARLWVNPDCGLKTRNWPEVEQALSNMVTAAKEVRAKHFDKVSSDELVE